MTLEASHDWARSPMMDSNDLAERNHLSIMHTNIWEEASRLGAVADDGEQRGLAAAAGAHQRQHLPGLAAAAHIPQHLRRNNCLYFTD